MTPSDRIDGSNRNKWTVRPVGPRTLGMVCAVATAGALLAGCGGGTSGGGTEKEGAAPASPARAASPSGSMSPSGSASLTEDQAQRKQLVPKIKFPYDKALDAALKAAPGTKAVSLDLDDDGNGGDPVWEVKVAKSDGSASTVRVDAVSGKAQKPQAESDEDADDKSELAARLKSATVTAQQAARTALAKKKGTVTAIELEGAENSSASPSSASPGSASPSSAAPGSASPSPGTENGRNGSGKAQWSVDVVTSGDWNKTTFDIDAADNKVLGQKVDKD